MSRYFVPRIFFELLPGHCNSRDVVRSFFNIRFDGPKNFLSTVDVKCSLFTWYGGFVLGFLYRCKPRVGCYIFASNLKLTCSLRIVVSIRNNENTVKNVISSRHAAFIGYSDNSSKRIKW